MVKSWRTHLEEADLDLIISPDSAWGAHVLVETLLVVLIVDGEVLADAP